MAAGLAVLAALVAGTLVTAAPAPADEVVTAQAKADALRAELAGLQREASLALQSYSTVYAAYGNVVTAKLSAQSAADAAERRLADGASTRSSRIRSIYESGGRLALLATLVGSRDLHDVSARLANVQSLVASDRAVEAEAALTARAMRDATRQLDTLADQQLRLERQAATQQERFQKLLARTDELLRSADDEVRRLVEKKRSDEALARIQALQATAWAGMPSAEFTPDATARYACPVGFIHNFVDTWGAPRSGGRRHQGTDVFAPLGSGAYAVTDGVITKHSTGGLGGIALWLRSDSGDEFYYAHNVRNIAQVGQRVQAGELIAEVGQTGNAATTPPHVHFQLHPGGGAPVNPYPFLKGVCG